jgi:nucleoside-diphosphate-sugar epimerase
MTMRVFVAGGSGVLGQRLVSQLVARGHQVTATTATEAKLGLLAELGAQGLVMDGLDAMSVGEAVATARQHAPGRRRSAMLRRSSSRPAVWPYAMAGCTGRGPSTTRSSSSASGSFRWWGGGTGYSSRVHVDDAASATVLAVEQKARGVFDIVDDEPAPAGEWLPYLAECVGAKRPQRLPTWLARLLAGQVAVTMMTEGRGFSNAKAKRELGWQLRYPSWRQGFKEELT